jgi:hypothetical protein
MKKLRRRFNRFVCRVLRSHKMTDTALGAVRYQPIDCHVISKWGTSTACARCGIAERFTVVVEDVVCYGPVEVAGSGVFLTDFTVVRPRQEA